MQKRHKNSKYNRLKYILVILLLCIIFIESYPVFSNEMNNSDTDSDGLNDLYEKILGSDFNDSSDVIDVSISDSDYLLVDTNSDNTSDVFFDTSFNRYNTIENVDGVLYIDSNFDDKWDYTYYKNNLKPIENFDSNYTWVIIIAGIIISIIIVIIILFKTGILYFYEEEYIVEE